ncbi:MAG TPA: hypothetical protein VNL69_00765 [Bacteroidota bacterium]|nr:hypothetical protein [Bacteroidota bacterium]
MKYRIYAVFLLALSFVPAVVHAQIPAEPPQAQQPQTSSLHQDSLKALVDTLKSLRQRIERLQGVLDKVTFGPQSYYFTRLRSWTIPLSDALNDSICQYFFEVLDNDSSFLESRGDIQVIATPEPSSDLVAIYFTGNNKERKGQRLREVLQKKPERNMYRQILESREYSEDKELIDRKFRIADLSAPKLIKDADTVLLAFDRYGYGSGDTRDEIVMTVRLFDNIRVRFYDMWGLEARLGNEEISHPFWTSGNLNFFIIYQQLKVGAHIPFKWGTAKDAPLSSVWKPRNLTGTYGVVAEFDWAYAGGSILVGFPRSDADGTFPDTNFVHYIKGAGTIWYSYTVSINNNANLIRMKLGLGAEYIGTDQIVRSGGRNIELVPSENRLFWSPYGKAEFMNQQFARRFGANLQYFRDWLQSGIWMEIIPEQLRIEAKFFTLLTRQRDAWEPPFFFTISIPYTFSL